MTACAGPILRNHRFPGSRIRTPHDPVTRVDFYILSTDSDTAWLHFTCRIADKAMRSGQQTFINSPSDRETKQLDDLLWTFSQGSFVPHRVVTAHEAEPVQEPVAIGTGQEPRGDRWNVLINLAPEVPEFFSRYETRRRTRRRTTASPQTGARALPLLSGLRLRTQHPPDVTAVIEARRQAERNR